MITNRPNYKDFLKNEKYKEWNDQQWSTAMPFFKMLWVLDQLPSIPLKVMLVYYFLGMALSDSYHNWSKKIGLRGPKEIKNILKMGKNTHLSKFGGYLILGSNSL